MLYQGMFDIALVCLSVDVEQVEYMRGFQYLLGQVRVGGWQLG